jgi:hypothetical protein
VRLVLQQTARPILAGTLAGLSAAFLTNHLLTAVLVDAPGGEGGLATAGMAALVLGATATAASLGPALRAARIDPKTALLQSE